MATLTPEDMPDWTENAGGRAAWVDWAERKIGSLIQRAKKWQAKRNSTADVGGREVWREALKTALQDCKGLGIYSQLPITLDHPQKGTAAMWPSVEHLQDPATPDLAMETRLVNDMATIMSKDEFFEMVGHIAAVNEIAPVAQTDDWKPQRSFAVEQEDSKDEPPLPSSALPEHGPETTPEARSPRG